MAIQLTNMDSRLSLKLLVHGTGLLSLKLRHWLYLDQILLKISVHPFRIIPWKGPADYHKCMYHVPTKNPSKMKISKSIEKDFDAKANKTSSTKSNTKLIKIEQAICDSHFKEKLNEESIVVAKIKNDPYSLDMLKNVVLVRVILDLS